MLRTIKTTATDRHQGLSLAELALFYNDAHDAGAPPAAVVKAEVTIAGKVKSLAVEWEAEEALELALTGAGVRSRHWRSAHEVDC